MKTLKNKMVAIAIVMLFMLSLTVSMTLMPTSSAHTPAWNIPTWAYITSSLNPIGIGQNTELVMWLNTIVPTATGSGGDLWMGYKVIVTAPDGTNTTLGPFTSSQEGTYYTEFTPSQVGNYTLVFSFPGQTLTNGTGTPNPSGAIYVGDYFEPSTSTPLTITVQSTPVSGWVEPPLPTSYWTLPINAENPGWGAALASNYLKGGWFTEPEWQLEGTAPNSAHILWQEPMTPAYPGGILDAQWPYIASDADDYINTYVAPIIMNGIIYQNIPQTGNTATYGYYAVSLYTGQTLWQKNGTDNGLNNPVVEASRGFGGGEANSETFPALAFGQLFLYHSVNGEGVDSYLWMTQSGTPTGTNWYMLDPSTGNWIMTLTGVPSGTQITDAQGDILIFSYNAATGTIVCWNSTQAIPFVAPGTSTLEQQWRPQVGSTISATNDQQWLSYGLPLGSSANTGSGLWTVADEYHSSYSMNVSMPSLVGLNPGSITAVISDDQRNPREILGWTFTGPGYSQSVTGDSGQMYAWCVQINYGATGYNGDPLGASGDPQANTNLGYTLTLLWNKTLSNPLYGENVTLATGGANMAYNFDNQVFCVFAKETTQWFGYSLSTGNLLWGPTAAMPSWDMYDGSGTSTAGAPVIVNGELIMGGYAGILYAYNDTNGNIIWTYTAPNQGGQSPFGNYPLDMGLVCNGMVYVWSSEHAPNNPLWAGSELRCINITNGDPIWAIQDYTGYNAGTAIADGYIISGNRYDNMIYAFGKGPSATTVTAPTQTSTTGTPVLIQGMVTDQSPGALGYDTPSTKGTPAVSDDSMQQWMQYLYEQQAMPTNVTGVPVTLTYVDPNNNTGTIGTTTTMGATGHYAISWTPTIPGVYTVTATFCGTNSYGDSYATTSFDVANAPAAAATATPVPLSLGSTQADIMYIGIAIIVVVIVIGAVLAMLLLRKRP